MLEEIENIKNNSRLSVIGFDMLSEEYINDFVINMLQPDIILHEFNLEKVLEKLEIKNKKIFLDTPLGFIINNKHTHTLINSTIRNMKNLCDTNGNSLILKNAQYISLGTPAISFPGRTALMYTCDVLFQQDGDVLKCIKNRFGQNFEINLKDIKRTIRKLKLNKIDGKISNRN